MSQLSLPMPRDRPEADLSPLDKACMQRAGRPTNTGKTAGLTWAVWQETTLQGQPSYVSAAIVDENGRLVRQAAGSRAGGGTVPRVLHKHADVEAVQWACIRHATHRALAEPNPVNEVRRQSREDLEDKTLRIHHDRREIDASDVESHVRRDGGRMTFHHSLQA